MNVSVRNVLERKLLAAGSEVAICVPVALQVSVYGAHHGECSNIKLASLVEEWLLDVLLHDIGPFVAVDVRVLDQALDVVQVATHLDAAASVGVLSRFDDPNVLTLLRVVV